MAIKTKKRTGKMEVDLNGPQGNAFCLLGIAAKLSRQLGKDTEDINKRMTSGGYENLIAVFDAEFGDYVDLYR